MRWSERQQAMLREMGLTLWQPASGTEAAAAADAPTAEVARAVEPPLAHAARPAALPSTVTARPAALPVTVTARPAALPSTVTVRPAALPSTVTARAAAPPPADAARNAAIADMDWPTLRAAVAECTACDLCRSRQQPVFGVGHERAHWMIVGEAPGEQEDLAGEPFVGAAGRLLDRMLLALGLTRQASDSPENAGPRRSFLDPKGNQAVADGSRGRTRLAESWGRTGRQVYIANTLKCRPPRNRNPQPQELAQCLPFLERQVALIQPKLILAMGRFAVQSLLGSSEPIGRLRGKVHHWRGVAVVVTYHPAYLLRQPTEKARAWADLCLAAETLQNASGD